MESKPRHPLMDEIARIQERDGLTGSDLARRLEVNQSTITRLMSGEMQPSLRNVQRVNRAFPELRSFCAQILLISSEKTDDRQTPAEVAR